MEDKEAKRSSPWPPSAIHRCVAFYHTTIEVRRTTLAAVGPALVGWGTSQARQRARFTADSPT